MSANPANPHEEIVLGVALVGRPVSTRIVLSLEAAAEAAWAGKIATFEGLRALPYACGGKPLG